MQTLRDIEANNIRIFPTAYPDDRESVEGLEVLNASQVVRMSTRSSAVNARKRRCSLPRHVLNIYPLSVEVHPVHRYRQQPIC
jgi:hypothetical protein